MGPGGLKYLGYLLTTSTKELCQVRTERIWRSWYRRGLGSMHLTQRNE